MKRYRHGRRQASELISQLDRMSEANMQCFLNAQMRERIRYVHYGLSSEKVYLHWVRFFILWHGRAARCRNCWAILT